jgi:ABC-type nitrate/sulfonate/bicarbonate transport system ATPase subunit
MITVERLTKRRGARAVVSDVTFRCEPGTVTGFLGPNGAGKITTMRMLVGLSERDGPSAVIGLRDALTGNSRATRVRQLATPSWLSTRPNRSSTARRARSRCPRNGCENSVINLEPATAAGSPRFSRLPAVLVPPRHRTISRQKR